MFDIATSGILFGLCEEQKEFSLGLALAASPFQRADEQNINQIHFSDPERYT